MLLSKRLKSISELITGNVVADIGTDHAYIPIYLINNKKAHKIIAMDINKGPLERAKENILLNKCEGSIEIRLSDGLSGLKPNEADSVLIAGMGGALTVKILTQGKEKLEGVSELILQPQSEICLVRRCLHKEGYRIVAERMLIDDNKFYVIIKAIKGCEEYYKEVEYKYGKILLNNKDHVLKCFLSKEERLYNKLYNRLSKGDTHSIRERISELKLELKYIKEGLGYYEMQ